MGKNRPAARYAKALSQVQPRHAAPILEYVTRLHHQLAAHRVHDRETNPPPTTTPAYTAALTEAIAAAGLGASLQTIQSITNRHNLTPREHDQLAVTLFTGARLGLLQSATERPVTPHAREADTPPTTE